MQFTIKDRMWIIPENKFTSNKGVYKYVTGEGAKGILAVREPVHMQIQDAFKRKLEWAEYFDTSRSL